MVGGPPERRAHIGQLGGEPGVASRCLGLSHMARMSASRPAKWRACAARAVAAAPCAASCSSANWRIVSSIENRVRPAERPVTSSDLRTKASSRSRIA